MPVENKYVNSDIASGTRTNANLGFGGATTYSMTAVVAVAAADDDGSIYRIFKDVPSNMIPAQICVNNGAITAATDYDFGLYKTQLGAVVDKDVLADGVSFASARAIDARNNVGMTSVALADYGKSLAQLSGQTKPDTSYDIAITANTVGTAAGTIIVHALFIAA